MQTSLAPKIELERARRAIDRMAIATTLEEFEEEWKVFLHRLERAWNKTKAHYGRSPKFGNWSAHIEALRKSDPLLCYLHNARGAEEHTIAEITSRLPSSIDIGLAEGVGVQPVGSILIDHLEINSDLGEIRVKSEHPLKISFFPARASMLPVTNRGRTYEVPLTHLGKPIDPQNFPASAENALRFYNQALAAAEEYFVR
jgi:hypothetical protein